MTEKPKDAPTVNELMRLVKKAIDAHEPLHFGEWPANAFEKRDAKKAMEKVKEYAMRFNAMSGAEIEKGEPHDPA